LHGFCDASEKASGGGVYLRVVYEDTTISTHLILANSRVVPVVWGIALIKPALLNSSWFESTHWFCLHMDRLSSVKE